MRNERGSVVLTVGVFLVLLLFVGMATDFGVVLRYRRAMQNACDSGALAGAFDLKTAAAPGPANTAKLFAQRDMQENRIAWTSLVATPEDRNGQPTGNAPVRMAVSISATVPLYFLAFAAPSMQVAAACAAQIVPANIEGLQPIGMQNQLFQNAWAAQNNAPCPWGAFNGPAPCHDYALTVSTSSHSWGSGGTGLIQMTNAQACPGVNNGSPEWACVMVNGSGPTPGYCLGPNTAPPWTINCGGGVPTVHADPGERIDALRTAISAMCATPAPPDQTSKWIISLPLLNDQVWGSMSGGSTQTDIVGFGAFELDCPRMLAAGGNLFTGNNATLYGLFVSIQKGTTGNPNGTDTGGEAVILVQ